MSGLRFWDAMADLILVLDWLPRPTSSREGRCSFAASLAAGPAAALTDDELPLLDVLLPDPLVLELLPELLPEELLLVDALPTEPSPGLLAVTGVPFEAGSFVAAGLSMPPPPHATSVASRAQPAPRMSLAWNI